MAEAKSEFEWTLVSHQMALAANAARDPKKTKPFKPSDFNPYAEKKTEEVIEVTKENVGIMRRAFTGKG